MRDLLFNNPAETIAVFGLCVYFLGMAVAFMSKPLKFCERFAVKPVDNAGVTEIRVYYGGISLALSLFLGILFFKGHGNLALIGGLVFANVVLFTRLAFTFIDKAWKCPYTKLAIPAETIFVIALWVCYIISKVI